MDFGDVMAFAGSKGPEPLPFLPLPALGYWGWQVWSDSVLQDGVRRHAGNLLAERHAVEDGTRSAYGPSDIAGFRFAYRSVAPDGGAFPPT